MRLPGSLSIDRYAAVQGGTLFVAGMARSGTTWLADLLNHRARRRYVFEPFWNERVRAARAFARVQYMHPTALDPRLSRAARCILRGRFRSAWSDQYNRVRYARSRIVKDVRANLMLGWLLGLEPGMDAVFIVRHPHAVVRSWRRLRWGDRPGGTLDLASILSQAALHEAYPRIAEVQSETDLEDYVEHIVFLWCVQHYVAFRQLAETRTRFVFYEDLAADPVNLTNSLATLLGEPVEADLLELVARRATATDFLGSAGVRAAGAEPATDQAMTESEKMRAARVVAAFDLDGLYDADGMPRNLPFCSDRLVRGAT